ncbi:MAG: TRAP transporter large permease [Bordetella sp.]|nr:TRAP transporter large permease [Bordetella sp.]
MIVASGLLLLLGLAIGLPIVASLICASALGVLGGTGLPLGVLAQRVFVQLDSFPLLAAPLFIIAGAVMDRGGMSRRMIDFAASMVGHLRAGLAQVAVMSAVLMSSFSGSQTADTAAIGSVLIPEMTKRGYRPQFAAAVVAAAGGMALLIPPSVMLLMYGFLTNTSIGTLFIAGIVPGLMMCLFGAMGVHFAARGEPMPPSIPFSWKTFLVTGKDASWALLMPLLILVCIRFGIATITEAAVIAVVYGLFVSIFIYKDLKVRELPGLFVDSAVLTGVVMAIVGCAAIFSWYLTSERVPTMVGEALRGFTDSKVVLLMLMTVVLLLLGAVFEITAALIMTTPILFPLATSYGVTRSTLASSSAPTWAWVFVTRPSAYACSYPPASPRCRWNPSSSRCYPC